MKIFQFIIFTILSVLLFNCREQYTPPAILVNSNYLVVEGIINTGTDSTIIKLSRTVKLNNATATKAETKAKISIESDANASYPLKEITIGTYAVPAPGLNKTAKYRLRIITADNKTYLSDFVVAKDSPPIDSLGYKIQPNGLLIYVNTHDATNNTRYYRWDYVETWNFHSAYASTYIASGTTITTRTPAQNIFNCWATAPSTDIVLASSAKLTQDVIFNAPITVVPSTSEKVLLGYSILVKQYAITQDAFSFWQVLRTNTEELGSIFDAQPSQLQGNVHNANNSAEPVFGYISAGTSQQKRITVLYTSWPVGWGSSSPIYAGCALDTILLNELSNFSAGGLIPVNQVSTMSGSFIGYDGSSRLCVDCTLRGVNKKPAYWPQ